MTGVRFCSSVKMDLLNLFLVLIGTTACIDAAQEMFPGLLEADRHREAAMILASPNFVKQFSNPLLDDSGWIASEKCWKQVTMLREGFDNGSSWAFEMIDASSKIPSGLLLGNRMDLGMYDECMAVNVVQDGEAIRGRHCMYNVAVEDARIRLMETLSICMPSICEPRDVQDVLNRSFQMFAAPAGMNVSVSGVTCSAVNPREWTFGGIVTVFGFSALLLFLIACTICDIFLMYSDDKSETSNRLAIIRQFSLYGNACEILSTKPSSEALPALPGIRFFNMCLVIMAHVYCMNITASVVNLTDMVKWMNSMEAIPTMMTHYAVDTFFTMSGLLASYLFLKRMSAGQRFDIFSYYVHRYLRITPAFVALYLISTYIVPRMGSGALWDSMTTSEEEVCQKSWWSILFYVHNYVGRGCLMHTWSLAVDMHCFWISPFILYPLAKKPRIGIVILTTCLVASIVTPAIIGYKNKYTIAPFSNTDVIETIRTFHSFYLETHIRIAPWLIGVFLGYAIFTIKIPLTKATKWIGWILSFGAFAFCILGKLKFHAKGYEYDLTWETLYTMISRPSWAAGISWVIYACVKGFGGPIMNFLSLPIFLPLGRLSYPMYLVHYVMQMAKLKAARVNRFFSLFGLIEDFVIDLILAFIVGLLFSLIVECPVSVLEKLMTKRDQRKTIETKKVM